MYPKSAKKSTQRGQIQTKSRHFLGLFWCLDANLVPDGPRDLIFIDFGAPKHKKPTRNKQKLDSNMCIFMYFFYGESFLRRLVFCVGLLVTVLTPLHVWPLTPLFVPTRACGPRPKRRAAAPQRGRGVQPGGLQCIAGGAAMTRRRRLKYKYMLLYLPFPNSQVLHSIHVVTFCT